MSLKLRWWLGLVIAFGQSATAYASTDCIDVTTTGAVPDDGNDDQPAILAAINLALSNNVHAVCFPAGTFDVTTQTAGVSFNLGNPSGAPTPVPATDLLFIGIGTDSVIHMAGTGGGNAWTMFQVNNGAQRITFRSLVLDGSSSTAPSTTLLAIGTGDTSTISDIILDSVTLRSAATRAVVVQGSASSTTPTVSFVSIRSSRFSSNATGLEILEGVQGIHVAGNYFDNNSLYDVQTTVTQPPTLTTPIDSLSITSNIVVKGTGLTSRALYLLGDDTHINGSCVVVGNLILNGRIHVGDFGQAIIAHNVSIGGAADADGQVQLDHAVGSAVVQGNFLVRSDTVSPAPVLTSGYSNGSPHQLVIRDNVLVQSNASDVAMLNPASYVTFSSNVLEFASTNTNTYSGLVVSSFTLPSDYVHVAGNLVLGNAGGGSLQNGFRVAPGNNSVGHFVISGNQTTACNTGVSFDSGGAYTGIPLVTENIFDGANTDIGGLTSLVVAIGGNVGGPMILTGYANGNPPGIAAPLGSLFVARDGTANRTLWVRETTATPPAGWTSK